MDPKCAIVSLPKFKRLRHHVDYDQPVTLACVWFNLQGQLMLTKDGLLPSRKVIGKTSHTSFMDELSVGNTTFQWIYRASHNWPCIVPFLEHMRWHLRQHLRDPARSNNAPPSSNEKLFVPSQDALSDQINVDHSVLLREAFCVAALDLSLDLDEDLANIGALYDKILATGTLSSFGTTKTHPAHRFFSFPGKPGSDMERKQATDHPGKGQLLLIFRQLDRKESDRMIIKGFRFVQYEKIAEHLARGMRIPVTYLIAHLYRLKKRASGSQYRATTGTILGSFVLQAGVMQKNWKILARRDCPDRLPCVRLSPRNLNISEMEIISQLDGLTITDCISRLHWHVTTEEDCNSEFSGVLQARMEQLLYLVGAALFANAIFSARVVKVPAYNYRTHHLKYCSLLAFHIIPDIHVSSVKSSGDLVYTPLSFFQCQQQTIPGTPHHTSFDLKVHHEFSSMFHMAHFDHLWPPESDGRSSLYSSLRSMLEPKPENPLAGEKLQLKGPSHVYGEKEAAHQSKPDFKDGEKSNELMLKTALDRELSMYSRRSEPAGAGDLTEPGAAEIPTFVDELFNIAVARWLKTERMPARCSW